MDSETLNAAKKTVGEASLQLSQNKETHTPVDIQREVHKGSNSKKSYEEEIGVTVKRALSDSLIKGDFYVVVLLRRERTLSNVVRQMFFYRQTCPTPEYDQTVYKYHKDSQCLEYIWTVPDLMACTRLRHMREEVTDDQKLLLSMVDAFYSGELDKMASKLNKKLVFKY